jgi:hypothetical protein
MCKFRTGRIVIHIMTAKMIKDSYNINEHESIFLNFIFVKNSTCFGQTYCPSSGVLILYSQHLTSMTSTSCFEYSIKAPDDGL